MFKIEKKQLPSERREEKYFHLLRKRHDKTAVFFCYHCMNGKSFCQSVNSKFDFKQEYSCARFTFCATEKMKCNKLITVFGSLFLLMCYTVIQMTRNSHFDKQKWKMKKKFSSLLCNDARKKEEEDEMRKELVKEKFVGSETCNKKRLL